jgi:hypothetical protein
MWNKSEIINAEFFIHTSAQYKFLEVIWQCKAEGSSKIQNTLVSTLKMHVKEHANK